MWYYNVTRIRLIFKSYIQLLSKSAFVLNTIKDQLLMGK